MEQGAREAMAEQGAREAMAEQGAREAMVGPPRDRGPSPTSVSSAGALLPPPKISLGKLGVSGALRANIQKQLKRPWSLTGQLRPRPAGLSIRQRPAGDTMIGWLDNNGSSRLA